MRYATSQTDPLELDRRDYESLFDLMEQYRADHPDATDDECFEAVAFGPARKGRQTQSRGKSLGNQ